MKNRSNFVGKIFLFFIFFSIIESAFDLGNGMPYFSFGSVFTWIFVFFIGTSLISYITKGIHQTQKNNNKEENPPLDKEQTIEKSEYDFDDEFAIDPKDYE